MYCDSSVIASSAHALRVVARFEIVSPSLPDVSVRAVVLVASGETAERARWGECRRDRLGQCCCLDAAVARVHSSRSPRRALEAGRVGVVDQDCGALVVEQGELARLCERHHTGQSLDNRPFLGGVASSVQATSVIGPSLMVRLLPSCV